MQFTKKLMAAMKSSQSTLCVGLDPNLNLFPSSVISRFSETAEAVTYFCKMVIDYTYDSACAYKPNLAFFEALGPVGLAVFAEVIEHIPDDRIIIADAKRGDISTTALHYKQSYFDTFNVDAITLNPLMGFETLDAFRNDERKAVYSLALTSNKGASDFLKKPFEGYNTMGEYIAAKLAVLNAESSSHLGMVIGATQASEMKPVLNNHTDASLLIPGIGAQGGSIKDLAQALEHHAGLPVINSSRSIIFAGAKEENWIEMVEKKAKETKANLQIITERYV